MREYYEKPKRVIFCEIENLCDEGPDKVDLMSGIAFRDAVICDCCGFVFNLLEDVEILHEESYWYDMTDYDELKDFSEEYKEEIEKAYAWHIENRP